MVFSLNRLFVALNKGAEEVCGWFSEECCNGVIVGFVECGDKILNDAGELKSKRLTGACIDDCNCSGFPLDQTKAPLGNRPKEHSLVEPELGGVLLLSLKGKALVTILRSCLGLTGGGGMANRGLENPASQLDFSKSLEEALSIPMPDMARRLGAGELCDKKSD